jgi:hypothetical protein
VKKKAPPPTKRPRREYERTAYSNDYPINPPGGTDYVLKGIEADLSEKFKAACAAGVGTGGTPRSMRWVLLTLMHKYAKGEITL